MAGAAEYRAVPDERARQGRSEVDFAGAAFTDSHVYVKFAKTQAMLHICALQNQVDWLAFLQCDFRGHKSKTLRRHFDVSWGILGMSLLCQSL